MFIRYNEAGYIWEYDSSPGQIGAGPWVKLPIDYSQLINVPPSGVQAHHETHEQGGADKIVNLELSGGHPQIRINAVIPLIQLYRTDGPVNARKYRIYNASTSLNIDLVNDAESALVGPAPLMGIDSNGDVLVGRRLQIGGRTNAYPALRRTTTTLDVILADESNWAAIQALRFVSVSTGNNLSDLTCGATNFTAGINSSAGNNYHKGHLWGNGGYYYPTDIANGLQQSSYFLSSHSGVVGLYTNNDFYAARYMSAVSFLAHGLLKEYDRDIGLGHWDNFTPVIRNSSGPIAFQNPPTGRFTLVGNTCTFWANFDLSGIPSLGTGLSFDYPLPAAAEVGPGAMIGSVVLSNGDNVLREGNIAHTDSAKSRFLVGLLGAAGDTLRVKGVYEIAEYRNILPPLEIVPLPPPYPE